MQWGMILMSIPDIQLVFSNRLMYFSLHHRSLHSCRTSQEDSYWSYPSPFLEVFAQA